MARHRRLVVICLALLMVTPLFTSRVSAEGPDGDSVAYSRATTIYPVMNASTYNRSSFQKAYIGSDNNSVYNIAPAFTNDGSTGAADIPTKLTFGTSFRHKSDSKTYDMWYSYTFEQAIRPAYDKGDLRLSYIANLTNDRHWNIDRHLKSWTAWPTTWIQSANKTLIKHDTGDYDSDTTLTMGRGHWVPFGAGGHYYWMYLGAFGNACTCGSSKVSNMSIMLADVVGPKVTSIHTTRLRSDGSMEPFTDFTSGETIYLNLKFDENIRFANDQPMALADAPTLKFRVKRILDNIQETGVSVEEREARLVGLDTDTLTFAYEVPETYDLAGNPVLLNHYIYEVEPYGNQSSWVRSEPEFDLKLFGKKTSQVSYLAAAEKSTSLIVDLAGNPISSGSTVTLKSPAYMDNRGPMVRKIDMVRATRTNPLQMSRSDVFARIGEKVGFFVYFTERLLFLRQSDGALISPQIPSPEASIRVVAELNVGIEGAPITATAQYIATVQDGKNGPLVSGAYFELDELISDEMAMITYGGQPLPIGINRIYMDEGKDDYTLTDARGNLYETVELIDTSAGSRVMPAQQLWLDPTPPTAATNLPSGPRGYKPVMYAGGQGGSAFCFPVVVSDQIGAGRESMSLTNGVTGSFAWGGSPDEVAAYNYEYAVSGSAEQPDAAAYQLGVSGKPYSFTQLDSGNYIHLRFLDDVEYNFASSILQLYPVDHAGNVDMVPFAIDYTIDRVGPKISKEGHKTEYKGLNRGVITADIRIWDISEISKVEYQWTAQGSQPVEGAWTSVTTFDTVYSHNHKRVNIVRGDLPAGVKHQYTLHIRATDTHDYVTTASYDFEYNLKLPTYNTELVTNPNDPTAVHSLKLWVPETGEKAATDVWVMLSRPGAPSGRQWRYIRRFRAADIRGESRAVDIFAVDTNLGGWQWCELDTWEEAPADASNPAGPNTKYAYTYWSWDLTTEMKADLYARLRQWYGQETITIIARQIDDTYWPNMIFGDELYAYKNLDYRFASDAKIGTSGKINNVSVTPKTVVSYGTGATPGDVLNSFPDQPAVPRSLDGAIFSVTLDNARVGYWDLIDIGFASPETRFALYKTGEGASSTPLFTAPLIAKASQDIAIPSGVATTSGSYKVVVSVKAKGSGHLDRAEYANIFIDRRELDQYGVTQVTTSQTIDHGRPVELVTEYPISTGSRPSEIFASAVPEANQSINFQTDLTSLLVGTQSHYAAYIRAWNETASGSEVGTELQIPASSYPWVYLPKERQYRTSILSSETRGTILADLGTAQADTAACLPLLPGENLIKYQIALTSGYRTPEQTLIVWAGDEVPTIEIMLSPDRIPGTATNGNVVASVMAISSAVVAPETLQVGLLAPSSSHQAELQADFRADRQVALSENGSYTFYVTDKYHNVASQQVTVDYIDTEAPSLAVTNLSSADRNTFDFRAQIQDEFDSSGCQLYLSFDAAYAAVLGVDPETAFAVPMGGDWLADKLSAGGLFATTIASGSGDAKVVTLSGAFRYDRTDSRPTVARTITLYAQDAAGNRSPSYTVTLSPRNEPASYLSGNLANGGFTATFSKPILLQTPSESSLAPVYAQTKSNLPFYANGVYAVSYWDLFGDLYEDQITVDQYDALYGTTVSISQTAPTNQDVQVVINAAFNPDITLELPESIAGGQITPAGDGQGNAVGASITMSQNGTISYGIKPKDSSYPIQRRTVTISNIDKEPPQVELVWVYTAEVISGLTGGEIIVSLQTDEKIQPLENTRTTHTFTLEDQAPYTFRYADLAGNRGSITAIPDVEIVARTRVELDTNPPEYQLSVYQSTAGVSTKVAGYNQADYEALSDKETAFPVFSDVLQLEFEVYDENQTTLSGSSDGEPSPSVTVRGATVTVSSNAEFDVVITDANGNQTRVPISITGFDHTAPTGTVTYVKTGPFSIRGYLTMSDDRLGQVTLKNTSGVLVETEPGAYHGRYYHDFLDNESFAFLFGDAAGNLGSVVAAVTSLDMAYPIATISQWVPYFVDSDGVVHQGVLADTPTNSDVSLYLLFNKPIQSITPTMVDGSPDDISISQTDDSATVVFRQNAKLILEYTATNTRSSSISLTVDIIDKTAPVVSAEQTAGDFRSVTYKFTSNESVTCHDSKNLFGTSFTKVFDLNGNYELRFTDRAGNTSVVQVTVSGIDRVAPSISVMGLPATKASVEAYNKANDTKLQHTVTRQPVTITASMDEAGIIYFRGRGHVVDTDQPMSLQIDANGIYEILATDRAGMTTRYAFTIDCIDQTKPQITFSGNNLAVRQGTTIAAFETKALESVSATDNLDPSPLVTISSTLTASQLETPGTYSIELTATDQAGNQRKATRWVRVYDRNAVEITVNGVVTQPEETLFVDGRGSREINVTVINPRGEEPYTIYWKPGLNTPGQMKGLTPFTGSFTAPRDGFYTLYLVTQRRVSQITYLYLQQ